MSRVHDSLKAIRSVGCQVFIDTVVFLTWKVQWMCTSVLARCTFVERTKYLGFQLMRITASRKTFCENRVLAHFS